VWEDRARTEVESAFGRLELGIDVSFKPNKFASPKSHANTIAIEQAFTVGLSPGSVALVSRGAKV
jgi:hypothetical protein